MISQPQQGTCVLYLFVGWLKAIIMVGCYPPKTHAVPRLIANGIVIRLATVVTITKSIATLVSPP